MASVGSERVFNRVRGWINQQTPWIPTSRFVGGTFRDWATGPVALPPVFGVVSLSCFELLLFAAAVNNAKPQQWFDQLYAYAGGAVGVSNWMKRWTANLAGLTGGAGGWQAVLTRLQTYNVDSNVPLQGDIVLFNQSAVPGLFHHAAIATGQTYNGHSGLLSFYGAGTNQNTPVIRTSIERMIAHGGQCYNGDDPVTVYFCRPPW